MLMDYIVMGLTSGITWIPLYLVLFYVVMRNNETMSQIMLVVCGAALCVLLADGITDGFVKPYVARWRPSNDPIIKYTIQVVDNLRGTDYGFFSAHAANTMSLAVFFSLLVRSRKMTLMLLAWSLTNCWTRLYLGLHYPSDILCGLLLGLVVGLFVYVLYLKTYRRISPDITYISNQYTSTGYDHDDVDTVLSVVVLTLVLVLIHALVTTYYI